MLYLQHMELLQQDNERLRNLLRWKDIDGIFWKWMESVLEEKRMDARRRQRSEAEEQIDTVGTPSLRMEEEEQLDVVKTAARMMCSSQCNLQQAVLKYESIVEHLERLCADKVRTYSGELLI